MKRCLSPFPIPGWRVVALLIAASSTVGCAGGSSPPPAPSGKVHVSVAPLNVNGVSNACYSLAITSPAGGSWSQSGICAEEYGDGQGAISFTAPCDATGTGANTVTLTVDNLFSGPDESVPLDRNTWNNPCGDPSEADYDGNPPCTQQVTCKANADTPVTFDLTIMRSSNRGFFDVGKTHGVTSRHRRPEERPYDDGRRDEHRWVPRLSALLDWARAADELRLLHVDRAIGRELDVAPPPLDEERHVEPADRPRSLPVPQLHG